MKNSELGDDYFGNKKNIKWGEKFCDGHIASYLEDGTIERLGENF